MNKNFNYIFLSIFILFFALSVQAQEDDEAIQIPEIIISAERTEQLAKSSTATVNVLFAEEVSKKNILTFDQALESVPGVSLNRSAGTATNSMSIRGASDVLGGGVGNRVLLLIDGRPAITADTDGANWGMLPMDIMERVEIVKGALSPLYGSSAMGGVVNFITKSPTPSKDTKIDLRIGFYQKQPEEIRYTDKTSLFQRVGMVHSNSYNNLGYVFSISGSRSDGHRQNTDFSLHNTYGKLQYTNQKDFKMGISLGRTALERGYPSTWLIDNIPPYTHPLNISHSKTNDRQEKQAWNFDVFTKYSINSDLKLLANIYRFQNYSKSMFNEDNMEGDDMPFGFYTDSDAGKTGGLLQFDFSGFNKNYLIAGLDLQLDSVDSNPPEIMFGKNNSKTLAGFAQDRIAITDDLALMLGTRYDYRNISGYKSESQLSPKIGASYQVNDDTSFRLSLGQAFRSPSLAEIYLRREINSGIRFIENPDLRAEKLRLYAEAGFKHNLFSFLKTDGALFLYDYYDMIFWKRLADNEYQVVNLNRAVIKGGEIGLNLAWNGLFSVANYTYVDAKDRTEGRIDDTLPYKPKHTAYASIDYQYKSFRPGASIRYVSKIEEVVFYPKDAPEAFYVVNIYLSYNISDIIFSVGIDNLLNRQYEEMTRYRMPGRSFVFRVVLDY